jgi:hypothetical protein
MLFEEMILFDGKKRVLEDEKKDERKKGKKRLQDKNGKEVVERMKKYNKGAVKETGKHNEEKGE